MKFRPCIDIHNGCVKQIVGSSLRDEENRAKDNFVSEKDADYYASMYRRDGLTGGHIIMLNPKDSQYYQENCRQADLALSVFPGGMQIGGGIDDTNAARFIEAGASHVIVTSFVFRDGKIDFENLKRLETEVGKEHIVLDLSCRRKDDTYYIVTDRWQKFTDVEVCPQTLVLLAQHCSEFLIHAVDVEGKSGGIDETLAQMIGSFRDIPVTYAGGVRNLEDVEKLRRAGGGCLDVTVGSALDLFGGTLKYEDVIRYCKESENL